MELYASSKAILEIEYFDEIGTGLGPTLEFYTNTSLNFRKKKLSLWREHNSTVNINQEEYVFSPRGLIPRPISKTELSTEQGKKILYLFKILGKFVAKALLDFRILDLPFNNVFLTWILKQEASLTSKNISDIEPTLANTIFDLEALCEEKKKILKNETLNEEEKKNRIKALTLNGVDIDKLYLDFTLPGYPEIELKENGSNINVTIDNLEEYVQLLIQVSLFDSIRPQVESFQQGFSTVFSLDDILFFSPSELDILINGTEEIWSEEMLRESIKADHGYTIDSPAIQKLIQIMVGFTPSQQKDFLKFVTGSPRLPIGGLGQLNPHLTVVRKPNEVREKKDDEKDDREESLPSAMTCANYLKLPDYSSLEAMKQKILFAISEGTDSFHLS